MTGQETLLTKAFIVFNAPSAICAKYVLIGLSAVIEEWQELGTLTARKQIIENLQTLGAPFGVLVSQELPRSRQQRIRTIQGQEDKDPISPVGDLSVERPSKQ